MNQYLTIESLIEHIFILWMSLGCGYIIGFFCHRPDLLFKISDKGFIFLMKSAFYDYPFKIVPRFIDAFITYMIHLFKYVYCGFQMIHITIHYFIIMPNWWKIFTRS